jgi:4-hydroxy-3-methylbut-2-en-1-yl diphosphate synthase IspG/GcpE
MWHPNTFINPFWKNRVPVEVKLKSGEIKVIKCPSCARGMMDLVTEWRIKPIEKPETETPSVSH